MKKIISLSVAFILLATGVFASSMTDISGHWCEEIIEKWVYAEKINGYEDGSFKPDANISRAEYVKLLASLLPPMPYGEEVLYEDVKEGDWYFESVQKLVTMGVLVNEGTFNPSELINRLEVMVLAGKTFYMESEAELPFTDADEIIDEAKPYVSGLVEMGIISGYEDNTIRPLRNITRAEVVKVLDGFGYVYDKDSLEGITEKIYGGVYDEKPSVMYTRIDDSTAQYFLGLESLEGIEEALGSEPMISAQAHSVCLVRAKEGVDIEALKEKIRTSVDPRKWVCVGIEREEIIVNNIGNLIILIMDRDKGEEIEMEFLEVCGEEPEVKYFDKGVVSYNGYYADTLGEINEKSVSDFSEKMSLLLAAQGVDNAYFAVVPTKGYYINDKLQTPFDYDKMNSILKEKMASVKFIDLYDSLSLTKYAKSDIHWKQDALQGVLNKIGGEMGFNVDLNSFEKKEIENFKGYFAQKAEGVEAEKISYLTNEGLESATVDHFTEKEFKGIYNSAKLETKDPYTFFLSGAAPVIKITNDKAESEKELVILGDSFSLSIAPLLANAYKTVTIVDLRMVSGKIINEYVSFEGKDVLALYSDTIINKSIMLKF